MPVDYELAKRVLPHRLTLKMLPRRAAEIYVDEYMPDLEGEDRDYALSFAGQHIPQPRKPQPQDNLFCAAMFLAGVSLGDLANLLRIKKPTVHQKIGKKLNDVERKQRDRLNALDPEVLALCYRNFNLGLSVDPTCYDNYYPRDIGRALIASSIATVSEDRGNETGNAVRVDPSRPRRYSNRNTSEPSAAEIVEQVHQEHPEPLKAEEDEMALKKSGELSKLTDLEAPKRIEEKNKREAAALDMIFGEDTLQGDSDEPGDRKTVH